MTRARLPPGRTALLVEDDEDFREVARELLAGAGVTLREAANGAEGLAAFESERPDLVLLDLNLPDMTGLEVCKRMRAMDQRTPILLCSVRTAAASVGEGLAYGANGYILKPFSNEEFLERVALALRL